MNRSRAMLGVVGSQPRSETITVTPEMAKKWLATNTKGNRPTSSRVVGCYARDMAAGRWQLTHQGIAFNKTGELVDGQHRLAAIVEADVPVEMVVSTGFDVEYDSPLDQGRVRGLNHVMHREFRWIATARVLHWMTLGQMGNVTYRLSVGEIQRSYELHQSAMDPVWSAIGTKLPGGVLAALCWTYPLFEDTTMSFAMQVRDGEMLGRGDPAYALRVWLERNRKASGSEFAFATLSCLRAAYEGGKLASVGVGPTAYRWACGKRRAMKIGATPDASTAALR